MVSATFAAHHAFTFLKRRFGMGKTVPFELTGFMEITCELHAARGFLQTKPSTLFQR